MANKYQGEDMVISDDRTSTSVSVTDREDDASVQAATVTDLEQQAGETAHLAGRQQEERRVEVAPWSENDLRFLSLAILILIVGAVLRLSMLHVPPFMHDEGIHAWFSYDLSKYKYNPVYHGPLLYYIVGSTFAVLGDYDFTARLVPVLLGIGLMLIVIGPARAWLGTRGALWSAALLAISPVMVTYHRRLLHDALVLVLTLGSVLCFQKAREHPSQTHEGRLARLGLVALVTLFLCTKVNALFIIAMLFSFGVAGWLRRFWGKELKFWLWSLVPLTTLFFVAFASVLASFGQTTMKRNELALTVVCLFSALVLWEWLRRAPSTRDKGRAEQLRSMKGEMVSARREPLWRRLDWRTPMLALGVAMFILSFFYGHIYIWWREPMQIPSYLADTMGAIPEMVRYWGGQQRKPRLASRYDYFIVLMLIYELPIIIAAIGGFWRASRRRSPFTDLLLWWSFTSFSLYALANEKVPWLLPHIMLPLTLLAGWWLAQLRFTQPKNTFERQLRLTPPRKKIAFTLACVVGAVFLLRGVSATNFERGLDKREPMFFAHTTEAFRDSFFAALDESREKEGKYIWIDGAHQWPMVWYFRNAKKDYGAEVWWGTTPPNDTMRMAVALEEKYKKEPRFADWTKWSYKDGVGVVRNANVPNPDLSIWPRASWGAVLPLNRLPVWWFRREASMENKILGEWSHRPMVIATPP